METKTGYEDLVNRLNGDAKDIAKLICHLDQRGEDTTPQRRDLLFVLTDPRLQLMAATIGKLSNMRSAIKDEVEYLLLDRIERLCLRKPVKGRFDAVAHLTKERVVPSRWVQSQYKYYLPKAVFEVQERFQNEPTTFDHLTETREAEDHTGMSAKVLRAHVEEETPYLTLETLSDEVSHVIADQAEQELKRKRGDARIRIGAKHLLKMFSLPQVEVPFSKKTRNRLLEVIEREGVLSVIEETSGNGYKDLVWKNYSDAELETLTSLDHRATKAIMVAALLPRRRPSTAVIASLKRRMKSMSESREWRKLAPKLVDSWLHEFFEETSAWDTRSGDAGGPVAGIRYEVAATVAVRIPDAPITACEGRSDMETVDMFLLKVLGEIAQPD